MVAADAAQPQQVIAKKGRVVASPEANKVTWWPWSTKALVRWATTRSVPP
jgi:hypothetical protein